MRAEDGRAPIGFEAPTWMAWLGDPASPFTVGIEEELMLLDERDCSLAYRSDEVVAQLPPDLRERVSLETHAAVIEIATAPHARVADAVEDLVDLRRRLADALADLGLRPAAAGTHPTAVWNDSVVSSHPRYRAIEESTRVLARREPTLAMHVHVAVPTPDAAIRGLNRMRLHLPLLLALSANSPFWQGRFTGFASTRPLLFGAFPRSGTPRHFYSYRDWTETVELLVRSGAIPDPSFLWWDIRLQPGFGTLEVRIMDAQTTTSDAAALAALVQSLVRMEVEYGGAQPWRTTSDEVIRENCFIAGRDGMEALLIDPERGSRVPAVGMLESALHACLPYAELLGCDQELAGTRALAAENGAARQLAVAREGGLPAVAAAAADAFCLDCVGAQVM